MSENLKRVNRDGMSEEEYLAYLFEHSDIMSVVWGFTLRAAERKAESLIRDGCEVPEEHKEFIRCVRYVIGNSVDSII